MSKSTQSRDLNGGSTGVFMNKNRYIIWPCSQARKIGVRGLLKKRSI